MSKKNSNQRLIIILGALILIFAITQLFDSKSGGKEEVPTSLTEIPDSTINAFSVYPPGQSAIHFSKNNTQWMIESDGIKTEAVSASVESLLDELGKAKPNRLVAKKASQWEKYTLTDSLATKLTIEDQNIYFGKYSYQQAGGFQQGGRGGFKITAYVRLGDAEEIYSIEEAGWVTGISRDFNSWRKTDFLRLNKTDVTQISVITPEEEFDLVKKDSIWEVNGVSCDSTSIDNYLNTLSSRNERNFFDGFTKESPANYVLNIMGNNMSSISVKAWKKEDYYVLNSSLNPNSYFKSDSTGLFKQLFVEKDHFALN